MPSVAPTTPAVDLIVSTMSSGHIVFVTQCHTQFLDSIFSYYYPYLSSIYGDWETHSPVSHRRLVYFADLIAV